MIFSKACVGVAVDLTKMNPTDMMEPTESLGNPSSSLMIGLLSSSMYWFINFLTMLAGSSCKVSTTSSSSSSFIRLMILSSESEPIISIFLSLGKSEKASAKRSFFRSFIQMAVSSLDRSSSLSAMSTGSILLILSCKIFNLSLSKLFM